MPHDFYHDSEYKKRQSEITKKYWQEGLYASLRKPLLMKVCKNTNCGVSFDAKLVDSRLYCSLRCGAIVNNTLRAQTRIKKKCLVCKKELSRSDRKYCSNQCQHDFEYNSFTSSWIKGELKGGIGVKAKSISKHIRKYLLDKYQHKCSQCGWDQKNPVTGHVPLEVDHIDGNADNNSEENLRVICPNCHSLTASFRNLNKGKGRAWRKAYKGLISNSTS